MSKLFNIYKNLKQEDSETLYLFKSGIFYIFIDKDAEIVHDLLDLKLTNLNTEIVKCGFPENSLQKYLKLLSLTKYNVKIIDNTLSTSYTINDYYIDKVVKELLLTISNVNTENISIQEACSLLDTFKNDAKKIMLKAE